MASQSTPARRWMATDAILVAAAPGAVMQCPRCWLLLQAVVAPGDSGLVMAVDREQSAWSRTRSCDELDRGRTDRGIE
jgi:hypothetical protein